MSAPKFRIAVIGAGIGGLSCAIALARFKELEIQVYEAASEYREIGAGIGVWRRAYHVLQELGLEETLKTVHVGEISEEDSLAFVLRKANQENGLEICAMTTKMGAVPFHRADLQHALARHLQATGRATVQLNKRLVSYEDSATPGTPIKLHFKDGTTAECDVLVGADGIHSIVRKQMLTDSANEAGSEEAKQKILKHIDPMWTGCIAYRATIPSADIEAKRPGHRVLTTPLNYMGKNKHMISFPMAHNGVKFVNIVAMCSWPEKEGTVFEGPTVEDRPQKELIEQFGGWEQELIDILECVKTTNRWVCNALRPLPICSHGRVTILGDAAHAMLPHQGSGAGQAVEDSYVLASLLAHPLATAKTLPHALKVYEKVRLPKANHVWAISRENGMLFDFADPRFEGLDTPNPDMGRLKEMVDVIVSNWEWAWTTEANVDKEEALKLLGEQLGNATT